MILKRERERERERETETETETDRERERQRERERGGGEGQVGVGKRKEWRDREEAERFSRDTVYLQHGVLCHLCDKRRRHNCKILGVLCGRQNMNAGGRGIWEVPWGGGVT